MQVCKRCNKALDFYCPECFDPCLVAAAPDLLEACELVLWSLEYEGEEARQDQIQVLREAIAKAKGEDK